MATVQPPPTFAEVTILTENGTATFNQIWLKWFLDLAATLSAAGGGTIMHNSLGSIQGGSAADYFHLTETQLKQFKSNKVLTWLSM